MAFIADYIFDLALAEFDLNATHLYICSQEPTTFTQATSTYALGNKTPITVAAPSDRTPNGRKVTVSAITDGTVTGTGTATHWAIVKTTGSTLMATGSLASSQAVTTGNTFTLAQFDIGFPDAV
jgi:hypothetical protein